MGHGHKDEHTTVAQLLLTGAWANLDALIPFFESKLNITVREQPKFLSLDPCYITALGIALRTFYQEKPH